MTQLRFIYPVFYKSFVGLLWYLHDKYLSTKKMKLANCISIIIIIVSLFEFGWNTKNKNLSKFKLMKGKAWFLQYKPALFKPNLQND